MRRSNFLEKASFRIKNKKWLRYSSNISRRILSAMEEDSALDRIELAKRLGGVTKQYISKLLQGKENLSLQTIANISEAIGVELITFPPYKDSYIRSINSFSISDYSNNFQEQFQGKIKEEEDNEMASMSKETVVITGATAVYSSGTIAA